MSGKAVQKTTASQETQLEKVTIDEATFEVAPEVKAAIDGLLEAKSAMEVAKRERDADYDALLAKHEALTEEHKTAKASLRAQKGAATKARNTIEAIKEAEKPRELGPMGLPVEDESDDPDIRVLAAYLPEADEIVLAFSDGREELRGIAPVKVDPGLFRLTRGRLFFDSTDLVLTGPGGEGPAPQLAGVALLLDGEQVAWSPMAKPIDLGPGQSINLAGNIVFG